MVCPDPRMSEESRLAWQIHSWDVFHWFWLTTSSSRSPSPMRIHLPSHPAPSLLVDGTRQRGCGREALGGPLPGYCGGSEAVQVPRRPEESPPSPVTRAGTGKPLTRASHPNSPRAAGGLRGLCLPSTPSPPTRRPLPWVGFGAAT